MRTTPSFRRIALLMACLCVCQASVAGQRRKPKPDRITCTFEGQTYFPFGYYDPFLPNDMDVQTQISYRCFEADDQRLTSPFGRLPAARASSPKVNLEISLSRGSAGTYDRRMRGTADDVQYNVYLDSNRRTIWGDGTGGTSVYSKKADADNTTQSVLMYGRMPAGQNANGGAYADLLVITMDF
jgi:spore coat protein U-like protein